MSHHGLLTTVAWRAFGRTTYALEGSASIAGAAVQWLRDGLGLIQSASEIYARPERSYRATAVVFAPALAGLGAPHWDQAARGLVAGITRGTTAGHLARAQRSKGSRFRCGTCSRRCLRMVASHHALARGRRRGSQQMFCCSFRPTFAEIGIDRPAEPQSRPAEVQPCLRVSERAYARWMGRGVSRIHVALCASSFAE